MSLDGSHVDAIDHAIANLYIDHNQSVGQSVEDGYRQGHHDGYRTGWNKATNLSNSKLEYLRARANEWYALAEHNSKEIHRFQVALVQAQAEKQKFIDENNKLREVLQKKENYIAEFSKIYRKLRQIIHQLHEENTRLLAKYTGLVNNKKRGTLAN